MARGQALPQSAEALFLQFLRREELKAVRMRPGGRVYGREPDCSAGQV